MFTLYLEVAIQTPDSSVWVSQNQAICFATGAVILHGHEGRGVV